jgi:hypothetical protein
MVTRGQSAMASGWWNTLLGVRSTITTHLLVGHPGEHPVLAVAPVPAAVFGPGPVTDLDANQHYLVLTSPAGQPAGDGQRAVGVWGPRAGRSLAAPVGQASALAASSSPALPGCGRRFAARGAAAGEHGAHRRHGGGLPPIRRSERRSVAPQRLSSGGSMSMTPVTRPPAEDDAAHGHSSGQAPAAAETERGCPSGFRCSWCSYRWARGGSETVAAVGV